MTILDRILGRPARKAATGGAWLNALQSGPLLSLMGQSPQDRAARYLQAYKVGWFYKAESRISADLAGLSWTLSYEDTEGDNAEQVVAPRSSVPFTSLSPEEQFLRLAEKPNPTQTGFQLRQKSQIRLDMAGWTFLYLENGEGGGIPTAIYGIGPTRMTPSYDAAGSLIGWVMDLDKGGTGTPFAADEIICLSYASPDDGPYGVGVVEAVYAEVPLTNLMAQHTADVLFTGGRLAGMAWPRDRALTEDEFADAQRAWRNVTSDPNSARRLLLFPEPMEYNVGAATPKDLQIPELANLNRDNILSAFPIDYAMLGGQVAAGLNSGETRRYIRQAYWEGTIHPRTDVWEDTLQTVLIPRYEAAIGRPLDFDIEEPNLDDAQALTEKADALDKLINLGFDPTEAVSAVGLDHIAYVGPPAPPPMPPELVPPVVPPAMPPEVPTKAKRREEELPGLHTLMRDALAEQRDRLIAEIERTLGPMTKAQRKSAPPEWWDQEREDSWLRETLHGIYIKLTRSALTTVANEVNRIVTKDSIARVLEDVLGSAGKRITGINETTRAAVADLVSTGLRRGYSITQIANGVPAEAFAGIRNAPVFDDARAELVARTETMLAYNESAIRGYGEFGVERLQAIDGDFDPVCAERDGQVFTIDEALAIEDHPNGTLDWAPISDKARHEPTPPVVVNFTEPAARQLRLERDEQGRLIGVTNDKARRLRLERDETGTLIGMTEEMM